MSEGASFDDTQVAMIESAVMSLREYAKNYAAKYNHKIGQNFDNVWWLEAMDALQNMLEAHSDSRWASKLNEQIDQICEDHGYDNKKEVNDADES